jgi:hypothetical protein
LEQHIGCAELERRISEQLGLSIVGKQGLSIVDKRGLSIVGMMVLSIADKQGLSIFGR